MGYLFGENLMEPWRARPVPFCFHGFLPPPETIARVLTCSNISLDAVLLFKHMILTYASVLPSLTTAGNILDALKPGPAVGPKRSDCLPHWSRTQWILVVLCPVPATL